MKKLFIFIVALFLFGINLSAQQYRMKYSAGGDKPLSLENVIRLSLENSYDVLMIEQDLVIAKQRIQEAKFLYRPQFSINASVTGYNLDYPMVLPEAVGQRLLIPNDGHRKEDLFYGVGISAVQYIYGGGRISSTVDLALAADKETLSRYQSAKNAVIFNAKTSFYEYLFANQKNDFANEVLAKAQQIAKRKDLTPAQKILVLAELSTFEDLAAKAQADFSKARIKLLQVLNKELNSNISFDGSLDFEVLETDLKKLNLWAMEFRPEVKGAMYKLEMDNIAVKLSLTRRYPDILLGASYDRQGEDNLKQENMQVSLALKVPFGYNFGTQIRQKRAEQRQTVLRQAAIEDTVRAQVLSAYENLIFWQTQTPKILQTWEDISNQFNNFMKTKSNLKEQFDSLNYYYQAGVKGLEAKKEHLIAVARLENAVGKDLK